MRGKLPAIETVAPKDIMISEVRVYGPKGVLKDVISPDRLHKRHWRKFYAGNLPFIPAALEEWGS